MNISKIKYDQIRKFIISTIQNENEISFKDLTKKANDQLSLTFDGKVTWYVVTVKLDLQARKIIGQVPKSSPQKLRMSI